MTTWGRCSSCGVETVLQAGRCVGCRREGATTAYTTVEHESDRNVVTRSDKGRTSLHPRRSAVRSK